MMTFNKFALRDVYINENIQLKGHTNRQTDGRTDGLFRKHIKIGGNQIARYIFLDLFPFFQLKKQRMIFVVAASAVLVVITP